LFDKTIASVRMRIQRVLQSINRYVYSASQLSWPTNKLYYKFLLRITGKPTPVIVYTMGKVGSSTIIRSIANSHHDFKAYQVHWLTPKNMQFDETFYYRQEKKFRKSSIARKFRPTYIWNAEYLLEQFDKEPDPEPKWKVVSLTRDPVARNISSFFQNLRLFFGYDINRKALSNNRDRVIRELQDLFYGSFVQESEAIYVDSNPLTWFTDELGKVFDIEVFELPFSVDRGYEIYETPGARILIIKLEKLRSCAESALNQLLGVRNFRLADANRASDKPYSSLYRQFKKSIDLPDYYLDKLYESEYCRHFYTEEEIRKFRKYWTSACR